MHESWDDDDVTGNDQATKDVGATGMDSYSNSNGKIENHESSWGGAGGVSNGYNSRGGESRGRGRGRGILQGYSVENNESEGWSGGQSNGVDHYNPTASSHNGENDGSRGRGRGGFRGGRSSSCYGQNNGNDEDEFPSGGSGGSSNFRGVRGGGGFRGSRGGSVYSFGGNSNRESQNYNSNDRGGRGRGFRGSRSGDGYNRESRHNDSNDSGGRGGGSRGRGFGNVGGGYNHESRNYDNNDREVRGGGNFGESDNGGRGGFRGQGSSGGGGWNKDDRKDCDEGEGNNKGESRPAPYIPQGKDEDGGDTNYIPSGINFGKYADIPVVVTGEDVPRHIDTFEDSGLRDLLLANVRRAHYETPTPIQKHSIPIIMRGRDVMSCGQTGSGKTAAFLLPMLNKMLENLTSASSGSVQMPIGLIVAPTRELADQIDTEARKFARGSGIRICLIYGGTGIGHQLRNVEAGVHLLIATPGRLTDFINRGKFSFEDLKFLVLDEADRMLDMGFKPSIDELLRHDSMPPKEDRQTLLFSATFPEEIQRMADGILKHYLFVVVGTVGGANEDIDQQIILTERTEKRRVLQDIIDVNEKTIVFVQTKKSADFIASLLSQKDIPTTSIHGDRYQPQREEALRDFRSGRMSALVATDVAARGLDITGVQHVINYDMPKKIDEYVHRIGRTARVGNLGKASSLFDPKQDADLGPGLVKILRDANKTVPDFLVDYANGMVGPGACHFGGRDIRNPRDYGGRSNTDHYDGGHKSGGVHEDKEIWD